MAQNDKLKIGPFTYIVLKRNGNFALLGWTESTGIQKERWVNLKRRAA